MINTSHLTKVYHDKAVVSDLSLQIEEGEVFGFLGPNGAGKSTTLLMLAGLIMPTGGTCSVNGIDVGTNPRAIKEITGYLPEDIGFYGNLTANQNLDYFARFYGMGADERRKRIADLLALVNLDGAEQQVSEFSRGMKQRLGIAFALLNDPPVLLMDEPTANLDPEGVALYRRLVRELAGGGKTILVSSHILSEISQICSKVGIIARGQMKAEGTIPELVSRYSRDAGTYVITVETTTPLPNLAHEAIREMVTNGNRATITASSDIRDDISGLLAQKGWKIREITMRETTLEEVFHHFAGSGSP